MRADPRIGETPFIMVTAESKTENVIAAKKAGVNNYIVKPFNAQTLKAKIEAVLASKRRITNQEIEEFRKSLTPPAKDKKGAGLTPLECGS